MKVRNNDAEHDYAEKPLFQDDFFIPFDGNVFSDIQNRRLTPTEFCVYAMLLRQVGFETGVWTGSAYRIHVGWGGQLNQRTIQACLKRLAEKGLIKSFHRRGQRNDYAIAIQDYAVRFGKSRGCRLDASATTDPKHPVYRRAPAATAKSQRDDGESTANLRRRDSELSASPIARNTPEGPEEADHPNVKDEKRTLTTSTTTPTATGSGPASSDAGDASVCASSHELIAHRDRSESKEQPCIDRTQFIVAVRKIWERLREGEGFGVTHAQFTNAMAEAVSLGPNVFLATWEYWLIKCDKDLTIPSTDPHIYSIPRAWPLEYFMSSGALRAFAEVVRPVAGLAEGEVLCFLVEAQKKTQVPITVSNENKVIIGRCLDECFSIEDLVDQYDGRAMDAFVTEVVVPLEAKRRAEWEETRRCYHEREKNKLGMVSRGSSST